MATAAVTEDDVKLYDRQIRLWGLEAQAQYAACHLPALRPLPVS